MKLNEAKNQFVEAWGTLGTNWGINRTMAQIHALLMVAEEPLSTDQIMEELGISRGNANMNTRALIDWGLAERKTKIGERMEFFVAEKDIWKVAVRIIRERRKREIDPLRNMLQQLQQIDSQKNNDAEVKAFKKMMSDIDSFADSAEKITDKMLLADQNWFYGQLMKMILK